MLEKAGKKVGHLGVAATNLPHHLSRGFAKIFGRNLETEDLICFKFLKSLWRCRNEVAHGQPFLWIEDDVTIVPDEEFKMHFLKKGFCIIKWLRSVEDDYRPGA